jgi:hypothetical protein
MSAEDRPSGPQFKVTTAPARPTAPEPVTLAPASTPEIPAAPEAPARPRFEDLPPPAQRALKEAEERRRLADEARAASGPAPKEIRGREGPEPVRYGDWELKGIASDF